MFGNSLAEAEVMVDDAAEQLSLPEASTAPRRPDEASVVVDPYKGIVSGSGPGWPGWATVKADTDGADLVAKAVRDPSSAFYTVWRVVRPAMGSSGVTKLAQGRAGTLLSSQVGIALRRLAGISSHGLVAGGVIAAPGYPVAAEAAVQVKPTSTELQVFPPPVPAPKLKDAAPVTEAEAPALAGEQPMEFVPDSQGQAAMLGATGATTGMSPLVRLLLWCGLGYGVYKFATRKSKSKSRSPRGNRGRMDDDDDGGEEEE